MKPSLRWLLCAVLSLLFLHSASAHYNPNTGRWLSRDPIGEEGGFNRYAYCGNDPVNRWDYLGLDPKYDTPLGLAYAGWAAMGSPQWNQAKGGYFVPMRFIVSIPMPWGESYRDYSMPLADAQERAPYSNYIIGFVPQARAGLGTPNGVDFALMNETINNHPGFRAQMAIYQAALLAIPGGYSIGLVSRIPYANAVLLPAGSLMLGKELGQIAAADNWAERAERTGGLLGGGTGTLTFNAGRIHAAKLGKWVSGLFQSRAAPIGLRPLTPWYAKRDGAIFPGKGFASTTTGVTPITDPARLLQIPKKLSRSPFHHIFPQRPDLAAEFQARGINPHDFTMQIPEPIHKLIHSGGPRGGAWNQSWEAFFRNNPSATAVDVYKEAGRLIYQFQVPGGPVVPYP